MLRLRRHDRGQTLLEGFLIMMWTGVFFLAMHFIATIFDVSQKQTMLLRTQAFMELGNFSYYGGAEHGKDDVKDEKSHVQFYLGEKSSYVKVDIEKNKKWVDATKGELELTIGMAKKEDTYWSSFHFPKGLTKVEWEYYGPTGGQAGNTTEPAKFNLFETFYIAHNRSIDLQKKTSESDWKKTGMFSGGIHFNKFGQVANLQEQVNEGMVDNVDSVNRMIAQLVKDDSSLSDEAADLEKNLNVLESLSGGAVAAAISMAIGTVMHYGLDFLGNAISPAASTTGSAATQTPFEAFKQQLFGDAINKTMGGSMLSGIFDAVTSPVRMAVDGVAGAATGLAGLSGTAASGVTSGQSLIQLSSGLSQIGQTAQFGMAMGGANSSGLNIAVSALALPGAVASGIAKIDSGMNYNPSLANSNLGGPVIVNAAEGMSVPTQAMVGSAASGINYAEVMIGVGQITNAVGNLLVSVAPDLSQSIGMMNAAVGVLSAAANMPGAVGGLANAQTAAQVLQSTGQLTAGVGQLASGVATLAGKEDKIGGMLSLAGGTMMMAGQTLDFVAKLKLQGIEIGNPIDIAGQVVKSNIDNLKSSIDNFKVDMANSTMNINNSFASIFGGHKVEEGNDLTKLTAQLGNAAQGGASLDKLNDRLSTVDLTKDAAVMDELQSKMKAQYAITYAGDPAMLQEKLNELDQKFETTKVALAAQYNVQAGHTDVNDPTYKAQFAAGVDALKALNGEFQAKYKDDDFGLRQLKGMMYDNDQMSLAQNLIAQGKINEHAQMVEKAANEKLGAVGTILSATQGGARTNEEYIHRIEQINSLVATTIAKEKLDTKEAIAQDKLDRAMNAVQIAQSIPSMDAYGSKEKDANPYRSVYFTQPVEEVAESATAAKSLVDEVLIEHDAGLVRLSDFQITQLNAGKEKLSRIIEEAKGKQYDTPRTAFNKLRSEIYAREQRFQDLKSRLIACQDGEC